MRKIALLGLLVVLGAGCGRGWLPLFRGAPCNSCAHANPAMPAPAPGCAPCGSRSGYGAYEGDVAGVEGYYGAGVVGGDYYNGTVVDGGYIDGTIVSPSMTPVAPAS